MSCSQCFSGHAKTAEPKGSTATIYNRQTYVAQPSDPATIRGIIVIVPDAFGWKFVNNRILVDRYAALGNFKVYLPDFMDDNAAPPWMIDVFGKLMKKKSVIEYFQIPYYGAMAMRGFVPFLIRNRLSVSMPKVQSFFEELRKSEGHLPIGAAGFCWGGLHVLKLASGMAAVDDIPLIDAAFIAHPSNVNIPTDFVAIQKPVSLAIGDKDMMLPPAKIKQVEEIWGKLENVDTQVTVYPGAGHGFSVRGDPFNPKQVEQSEEAEEQALKWFDRHFSSRG
ncbi:dienelactone hydrolase [Xylogone sp. PMI_703]|nr:dienelactone hydrolase [Xylogone sp. PMI_703]